MKSGEWNAERGAAAMTTSTNHPPRLFVMRRAEGIGENREKRSRMDEDGIAERALADGRGAFFCLAVWRRGLDGWGGILHGIFTLPESLLSRTQRDSSIFISYNRVWFAIVHGMLFINKTTEPTVNNVFCRWELTSAATILNLRSFFLNICADYDASLDLEVCRGLSDN